MRFESVNVSGIRTVESDLADLGFPSALARVRGDEARKRLRAAARPGHAL